MRRRGLIVALLGLTLLLSACGDSAPDLDLSPAAAEDREIVLGRGCAACHGENGEGTVGPGWQSLFGSVVELEGGGTVVVDDAYLRRSILEPDAEIVAGATISMPVSTLTDSEVDAVVAYIKEL